MTSHVQEWDGTWKIMLGKQGKAWEGRSSCHSDYCTSELGLYWLPQGRANFSCRYSPSRATGDAVTGGLPRPHQCVPVIPLPARPSLLSALHRASSFVSSATGCGRVGCQSYCEIAFSYPVVRLQEFVLIPGTVKFDFVYATVNPWSSPKDCSYRAQNETIITLPFRVGLPT